MNILGRTFRTIYLYHACNCAQFVAELVAIGGGNQLIDRRTGCVRKGLAKDLIGELTLAYNKGRQQAITAEILDLVGGSAVQ